MDDLIAATARTERDHFWFRGFRRFVGPLVEQAAANGGRLRVLDCGCGTGANLAMLGAAGAAWGFDLNHLAVSIARRSGFTRVARASIGEIPFPDEAFDLVTSFDVWQSLTPQLERAAPREMLRVLRPGGAMIVNVAALPILYGNQSVLAEEKQRYTKKRLRELIEGAGFRVERITYTNFTLFPALLAVRTAQRVAGLKPVAEAREQFATPRRWINEPLAGLLAVEARLLRRWDMPVGSSLLCLARRPARSQADPSLHSEPNPGARFS